jgi:hypothetical protein
MLAFPSEYGRWHYCWKNDDFLFIFSSSINSCTKGELIIMEGINQIGGKWEWGCHLHLSSFIHSFIHYADYSLFHPFLPSFLSPLPAIDSQILGGSIEGRRQLPLHKFIAFSLFGYRSDDLRNQRANIQIGGRELTGEGGKRKK